MSRKYKWEMLRFSFGLPVVLICLAKDTTYWLSAGNQPPFANKGVRTPYTRFKFTKHGGIQSFSLELLLMSAHS